MQERHLSIHTCAEEGIDFSNGGKQQYVWTLELPLFALIVSEFIKEDCTPAGYPACSGGDGCHNCEHGNKAEQQKSMTFPTLHLMIRPGVGDSSLRFFPSGCICHLSADGCPCFLLGSVDMLDGSGVD